MLNGQEGEHAAMLPGTHQGGLGSSQVDDPVSPDVARAPKGRLRSEPVALHLVGRLTNSVFRFLGPATEALGSKGPRQIVLAMIDPEHPSLHRQFARHVKVVALPLDRNPLRRWVRWLAVFRRVLDQGPVSTVHLHGFIPTVLTAPWVRYGAKRLRRVYTPHGSRAESGASILHRFTRRLFRPWLRDLHQYVSLASEARWDAEAPSAEIQVLETPVDSAYFEVEACPSPDPLVVGGIYDDPQDTVARFCQMAVLLGNGDGGPSFLWAAPVGGESLLRLRAAEIPIESDRRADIRAQTLSKGWIFVCPLQTHGYPSHVAEALACGLPVVALDCQRHRDLIDDGKTGFLCGSESELLAKVLLLVGDPALRDQMGQYARAAACDRFIRTRFQRELLRNYPNGPRKTVA